MNKRAYTVAIDGPAATGKGTIAPVLAKRLHGFFFPTGTTYRCLALSCLRQGIDMHEAAAVVEILKDTHIEFIKDSIVLNGEDVSSLIRGKDVSLGSNIVAVIPEVRAEMVKRQQEIAMEFIKKGVSVVAEGRDTGTRLFPSADLKIFLTADDTVRAERRRKQMIEQGEEMTLTETAKHLQERDTMDYDRPVDPLSKMPEKDGYTVIDNSKDTEEETLDTIKRVMEEKGLIL